mmetsp:Transcript_14751/g.41118  ORF Transcript_14751/g.41118 Transcript_14751/m.41118 type:complete len:159 (-) Transcript_14751:340-816(-)
MDAIFVSYAGELGTKVHYHLPFCLPLLRTLNCAERYDSKLSTCLTTPPDTTQASLATDWTKNWSWLTQITAPSKFLTQSARAATLSRSRLLVGSSRTNTCGLANDTAARATRDRWPPESAEAGVFCRSKTLLPEALLLEDPDVTPQLDRCPRSVCMCS